MNFNGPRFYLKLSIIHDQNAITDLDYNLAEEIDQLK